MSQPRDIGQVLGDLLGSPRSNEALTEGELDQLAAAHPHLDAEFSKLRLIVQAARQADLSPQPSPTPLECGETLASIPTVPDCELLRLVSRGGFGQVWLGRNRHTSRYHAVKLIPLTQGVELEGVRAYQQRVRSHPGLIAIDHVGTADSFLYYVMPLADSANDAAVVEGPDTYEPLTLQRHARRRGPLPAAEVLAVAASLADALNHLHTAGLLHRDVKPANVLRVGGAWVLGDLGLTVDVERAETSSGTRAFWPPEGPRDRKADLYALGKTLFLVWTGAGLEQFTQLRSGLLPPRRLIRQERLLRRIVLRLCEDDPAKRYPTARALLDDLHRGRARAWPWIVAAVVIALLTGATLLLVHLAGKRREAPSLSADRPAAQLSAELKVLVEKADGGETRWLPLDQPGVLPVRRGNRVRLHAVLTEPAHVYLVWLDSRGEVFPLYPWNEDRIVRGLTDASPESPPRMEVGSPTSDTKGWLIDEHSGLETVLLLVRRTPPPADFPWGELFGKSSPTRLVDPRETALRGFDPGQPFDSLSEGQHRGIEAEARERDRDLLELLQRLRPHFDAVRAVRFGHQGD